MIAERIVARLEADTRDFETGMNRASGVIGSIGSRAQGSQRGLSVMRQALTGLAFQATGTAGPLGRLAQGLLLVAGGSTLVVGVAAGIGLIAAAYKALTADVREATKAQEDFLKSLDTPQGKVVQASNALATAKEKLAEYEAIYRKAGMTVEQLGPLATKKHEELLRAVANATNDLSAAQTAAAKSADQQRDVIKRVNQELDKQKELLKELRLLMERIGWSPKGPIVGGGPNLVGGGPIPIKFGGRVVDPKDIPMVEQVTMSPDAENRALLRLREIFGHLDEEMVDIGVDLGRNIIEGLLSGMLKMEDILRRFVTAFLSATLFGALGNVLSNIIGKGPNFGGGGVNILGNQSAGGPTGSVVGPAQFSLSMGGALPPATTPFAIMRDAEWIRLLTGSIIMARQGGFR